MPRKRKRQPPRKPAGTTGSVYRDDSGALAFQRFELPLDKRERERFIVETLLRQPHHAGPDIRARLGLNRDPVQNPDENDFDFLLDSRCGLKYLELTELAPLDLFGGSYDRAPRVHTRGYLADLAVKAILDKSQQKYGGSGLSEVVLLLYSTDWRLRLDEQTVALVQLALARENPGFSSVLYYEVYNEICGWLNLVFPNESTPLPGFSEAAERQKEFELADLTGITSTTEPVLVPLGEPGPNQEYLKVQAVPVDGTSEFRLAFSLAGSSMGEAGSTMPNTKPFITAALVCERVLVDQDGSLSAIHVFDTFNFASDPALPPGAVPIGSGYLLVILESGALRGAFEFSLRMRAPSGSVRQYIRKTVSFTDEAQQLSAHVKLGFASTDHGQYWFDVYWDKDILTSIPFKVVALPAREEIAPDKRSEPSGGHVSVASGEVTQLTKRRHEELTECFAVIESCLRCYYNGETHMYRALAGQLRILLCDQEPLLSRVFPDIQINRLKSIEYLAPGDVELFPGIAARLPVDPSPEKEFRLARMPFMITEYPTGLQVADFEPAPGQLLSLDEWMDQQIITLSSDISIRELVRSVADKGGGAHLDDKPGKALAELMAEGPRGLGMHILLIIALGRLAQDMGLYYVQYIEKFGDTGRPQDLGSILDKSHPSVLNRARVPDEIASGERKRYARVVLRRIK